MGKVLIIGSGGREHALGWKLAQSDKVTEVLYAPGNGGTAEGKGRNVPLDGAKPDNFSKVYDLIQEEGIVLTVVGPEQPLTHGLVDYLQSRGYNGVFGPTKAASQLESDKFYSYELMEGISIPQAVSVPCYTTAEAIAAINQHTTEQGIVIKARGLTAGKGVTVCDTKEQALEEITKHAALYGPEVLISERLFGQEFSVFGISDGNKVHPIELSFQDHKQLLEGDDGPMTGGMGAYGPAPIADRSAVQSVADTIMTPLVQRMKANGNEFKGFLYAGIMQTAAGPKVLEFNVRFGDPECQSAMVMLKNDLYVVLSSALEGKLDQVKMDFNPGAACCVVLASQGYPISYKKGFAISGVKEANNAEGVTVFHAGTKIADSQLQTAGGRVLGVTGYSKHGIAVAQNLAYQGVAAISVDGGFAYRKDIARKALK